MDAILSHNRFNRFMKMETFVSLTMFGVSIYMFIVAKHYYVSSHPSLSAIIGMLGSVFFLFGISTALEVVSIWRALKRREADARANAGRRVRFSSLLNVYEENDQSFDEENNNGNNRREYVDIWTGSAQERNNGVERNVNLEETRGATGGLSPGRSAEYWMSPLKDEHVWQPKNNTSFREKNSVWCDNKDNSGTFEEIHTISGKDKELFENDSQEEATI